MIDLVELDVTFMLIVKIGLILFLSLYVVFAFIVRRQVKVMTDTLEVGFEEPIKIIALFHFVVSIIALVVSLVIL